jgi:hypothetical protein
MSNPRKPWGHLILHVGKKSCAECFTYVARSPILSINAGSTSVSLSLAGDEINDDAVSFARSLVDQARLFAAEIERLHSVESAHRDQAQQAA